MYFSSLSSIALSLLATIYATNIIVEAKVDILSWDDAYTKAKTLVDQMSLEHKVNITTGVGWMVDICVGNTYATTNPDFPSLCLQDAPLGIRFADNVTSGVSGINAAASFDRKAILDRGCYIGKEFYNKGIHVALGPAMNFMRSPEGGRGWESGGEDPYLQGVMASEMVKGIQREGVIATAKHYILNDQELNRTTGSSDVDQRALHEIYVWPFARAVEAGVGSIMCSYNKLNGTYACEDDYTLNTVLKGELGFKGFVQSDWAATMSTVPSANAGLDMTMPGDITFQSGDSYFGANLTDAVKRKDVAEERVTDMATRIVASWYKMRQDTNFPKTTINAFVRDKAAYNNVQADHGKLVREMGAASCVLLKNSGILPISNKVKKIALIGSDSKVNPDGPNGCVDHGCNIGHLAQGWGSGTSDFPYLIDPYTGISNALSKSVKISLATDDYDLKAAASAAKDADIAFVFSSADSGEGYIDVDGNIGDRKNLTLWHNGDNLIQAVANINKNTVVIINSVGAVLMPWINHPNIKAVVWPGLSGQESGNSLADILTGKVNPSGRLPYTIAKKASDYNAAIDPADTVVYKESLLVGYRWFDHANIEPLFPFGHGLSYTTFKYSSLGVKVSGKSDSIKVTTTLSVRNTGKYNGAEVVQAYISFPMDAGEPPKVLRGFEKIFLKKGKSKTITIEFTKTELSIWDTSSNSWVIPSGKFTVHIGASSRDIRQTATFHL
ncbi:glycoside hydrolase superfamily [Cokeromyces recurvatus]|uniref:glycoside hydrolase superfamily n=1 Tax=Cokeromyces recurvatus TaxID=90255 RepID=UPI00221FA587|nr:glycoside hydrolase superfamily [Cokeromyces recurvatus]KAI7901875.1 glycoside hydrolase superfamily [Cokeromyces recurvatus]